MSIQRFIERICVQTAVYWAAPVADGYGSMTYADPVEIPCRWTDKTRVMKNALGEEFTTRGEVLVTQDLELEGWLFLGTLDDVESVDSDTVYEDNPMNIEGAYRIISIDKTPMIRSTSVFVRTVYFA